MQQSVDIVNLFEQFGGQTVPYRELGRDQKHQVSAARWPLVSAVQEGSQGEIPAASSDIDSKNDQRNDLYRDGHPVPPSAPSGPVRPAQSAWLQRAAPAVPAFVPVPVPVPARAVAEPVVAPAVATPSFAAEALLPSRSERSATLAGRSPLAGLATPRPQAAPAAPIASPQATLPQDLTSVFARLCEPVSLAHTTQQLAPAWSPVKGVT